jgi:hypothetical protein
LWLYSERGLLGHLLYKIVPDEGPEFILREATNGLGENLEDTLKIELSNFLVLTECDIGKIGFGSPDGGLLLKSQDRSFFIFIEGKAGPLYRSFIDPLDVSRMVANINWSSVNMNKLVEKNKFNSSINGQLELKWRFRNCFRISARPGIAPGIISEEVFPPNIQLMSCDRFYWRRKLNPNHNIATDWRQVDMTTDLAPFWNELVGVSDFYLLAVTDDNHRPKELNMLRLMPAQGEETVDVRRTVFWMPLESIRKTLRRHKL